MSKGWYAAAYNNFDEKNYKKGNIKKTTFVG